MRCFWDERQRAHRPREEFFNGGLHPAAECEARIDSILGAIGPTEAPADHGLDPILRVHDAGYVDFLQRAHSDWLAAGREGDAFPYVFPAVHRRMHAFDRIDADLGQYSIDTATPIGPGTWGASYWGAKCALSGVEAALGGSHAFALCRPPGHHAGKDYCGGYSYLNNAVIAAAHARENGAGRVAILDVDYHHGNGTQDMVSELEGIRFASLHADPRTDYPFYWGHTDENGDKVLNLPLPRGTTFEAFDQALAEACEWLAQDAPGLMVVSFGADTFEGDPISHFALGTDDYPRLSRRIASLDLPTLVVLEGGYAVDALGANVAAFLSGF